MVIVLRVRRPSVIEIYQRELLKCNPKLTELKQFETTKKSELKFNVSKNLKKSVILSFGVKYVALRLLKMKDAITLHVVNAGTSFAIFVIKSIQLAFVGLEFFKMIISFI